MLDAHPFIVQPITTSFIFTLGDILCQFLLRKFNNDGYQHDYIYKYIKTRFSWVSSLSFLQKIIKFLSFFFGCIISFNSFSIHLFFLCFSLKNRVYRLVAVISNQQQRFFTIVFTEFHLIILILLIIVIIEELFP